MVDGRWLEVPVDEEFAYINPNTKKGQGTIFDQAVTLDPLEIKDQRVNNWDAIIDELNGPEAASVDSVRVNSREGLIDVHESNKVTSYIVAAVGDKGSMSIVSESGAISTSDETRMPLSHHVAISEAIAKEFGINNQEPAEEMEIGFDQDYTDLYKETITEGNYEALGGDVIFEGFDQDKGVDLYESDKKAAEQLFDQLEEIAEFYRDFEDGYDVSDQEVPTDIPITPERRAGNNAYKFRLKASDKNANIVVSRDYGVEDGVLNLSVIGFSNHKGKTNRQ